VNRSCVFTVEDDLADASHFRGPVRATEQVLLTAAEALEDAPNLGDMARRSMMA
jgi:hypothetical protein